MCQRSRKVHSGIVVILQLCSMSCGLRFAKSFQVLRGTPAYLLRSPDSRETPLPDVLRDYNGFEPAHSSIDLRPLMALRIENAYYEKGSSRRGLQGFLGTEVARYEIELDGLKLVSVQPMANRPAADVPVEKLVQPSAQHGRYYRFYYEVVFNSVNHAHGSVLLSGDSEEEIQQLSAQLQHPDTLCGDQSGHCTVFPEACSVSVEMKVFVNGRQEAVVWGSLLSSLTGDHPRRLEMKRLFRGRLMPVRMDARDAASLRVPMLPGDWIDWK